MMPTLMAVFLGASALTVLSMPGLRLEVSYAADKLTDSEAKTLAARLASEIRDDFCKRREGHGCQPREQLVVSIDLGSEFCAASVRLLPNEGLAKHSNPMNESVFNSCYFDAGDTQMHAAPAPTEVPL